MPPQPSRLGQSSPARRGLEGSTRAARAPALVRKSVIPTCISIIWFRTKKTLGSRARNSWRIAERRATVSSTEEEASGFSSAPERGGGLDWARGTIPLLSLALAFGGLESAASPHPLAESLPLLWCHPLPALRHAAAEPGPGRPVEPESSE